LSHIQVNDKNIVHRYFPILYPGNACRHRRASKEGSAQFLLSLFVFLGDISAILSARKLKFGAKSEDVLWQK